MSDVYQVVNMLTEQLYVPVKVNQRSRVSVFDTYNKAVASARSHYRGIENIPDTVRIIRLKPVESIEIEK